MSDQKQTVQELKDAVEAFIVARDWAKFNDPKSLSMSIAIEAAELMEIFQWTSTQDSWEIGASEHLREELADVMIYCLRLASALDIDVAKAIEEKIVKNGKKYPVEESS